VLVLSLITATAAPLLADPVINGDRPGAGDIRTNPVDGAEMVWVPGGKFIMGNTLVPWATGHHPHEQV